MKKVVFIQPCIYDRGGLAMITNIVMNALANLDLYEITSISLSNNRQGATIDLNSNINHIDLAIEEFKIRRDTLKAARLLRKTIPCDFDGTIVVTDIGHTIPIWLGLHSRKTAKFIVWTHTNFFNGSRFGFSGIGKVVAMRSFDKLIALTKEDEGYFRTMDKRGIVTQIYNPINNKIQKKPYQRYAKKIISCGRLNSIKGFDLLIEVAKIVFDKHPDWRWDIYGEGEEKNNLEKKIKEYKLEDNLFLMGFTNDILSKYGEYSFNVFTSRGEGCPLAMIEAQSAGLPVISFNFHCGPKDMIVEGINGYIIDGYDIQKMAMKVCELIEDDELRGILSGNSGINLQEFNMKYVIEKWKEIL